MAKATDRVPTYPGRVLITGVSGSTFVLTPVVGQPNTYTLTSPVQLDMERADAPTVAGTALNKAFFDLKADLNVNEKVEPAQASSHIVSVTASKTLALTDAGTFQYCTNGANANITVPLNSSVAFPVGTEIEFYRNTTFTVTFVPATAGVTFLSTEATYTIADRYTSVVIKKVDTDTWVLQGNVG